MQSFYEHLDSVDLEELGVSSAELEKVYQGWRKEFMLWKEFDFFKGPNKIVQLDELHGFLPFFVLYCLWENDCCTDVSRSQIAAVAVIWESLHD